MRPVQFECRKLIPKPTQEICAEIADVARWSEFDGYGLLPGILRAEYERRTDDMVGSRIRVHNRDGSTHVEEVLVWQAGERIVLKLHDFSPPLDRLAAYFLEQWRFEAAPGGTWVCRDFQLFATRRLTRPALWLISRFLRRAIVRHLDDLAD